ncbi:MAG: helix-turn-helix transcriptional regulator [Coriobacteriia bacterium]|nr:helix-turn-helix transcriptional regulator [Coriobacteriia bacterium]
MGKKLGNAIRAARTDAGYTQEQLARKVRGVTTSDIGRYERGESEPNAETVKSIAKACGVTQKSLLDCMPKSTSRSTSSYGSSSAKSSMQVTATERRLVELYRQATTEDRKQAMALLRGSSDAGNIVEGIGEALGDALAGALFRK